MFIREKERTKLVTTQFSTFFYRDRIDRWSSKKNLLNSKMPFQSRMMFFRWHQHDAARSNCSISAAARHDDGFSRERGCSKKKKRRRRGRSQRENIPRKRQEWWSANFDSSGRDGQNALGTLESVGDLSDDNRGMSEFFISKIN